MRLNKFLALHTTLSRRGADKEIENGRVTINGVIANMGATVEDTDEVRINGKLLEQSQEFKTILFHKPTGYICSREGQGSDTIYDILPKEYHNLNTVGRLDKESSGLLLLTNNGDFANKLTHPRYGKVKRYEIQLDKPLLPLHQQMISDYGVTLTDGPSKLSLLKRDKSGKLFEVVMSEGRNRQIRRTFSALGYRVVKLHRTQFGDYHLGALGVSKTKLI